MQIVIDIDENCYKDCKTMAILSTEQGQPKLGYIYEKIAGGTPLPKGHGRLIDADELKSNLVYMSDFSDAKGVWEEDIDDAETIIEADKER